ncbi:hypothetical protein AVEN_26656-1 [Araneus ventricosus]|uniref:Uncharacterized protein n=1 Tax=Araneus ventricosus TaxID=182803 RepID=A0A4Y2PWZ1_ARAVE|nr:hypothetical protein AVEN_26656-1 [Araneus ventricosus]
MIFQVTSGELRWLYGKVSVAGLNGSRFETKFQQRSTEYVGFRIAWFLVYVNSIDKGPSQTSLQVKDGSRPKVSLKFPSHLRKWLELMAVKSIVEKNRSGYKDAKIQGYENQSHEAKKDQDEKCTATTSSHLTSSPPSHLDSTYKTSGRAITILFPPAGFHLFVNLVYAGLD